MAADLATLQARLVEAEAAYHTLQTGGRVAVVARDGRRLEYTSATDSLSKLRAYIAELNAAITELTGVDDTNPALRRRAGRFFFA
jgi:hypothetical protein